MTTHKLLKSHFFEVLYPSRPYKKIILDFQNSSMHIMFKDPSIPHLLHNPWISFWKIKIALLEVVEENASCPFTSLYICRHYHVLLTVGKLPHGSWQRVHPWSIFMHLPLNKLMFECANHSRSTWGNSPCREELLHTCAEENCGHTLCAFNASSAYYLAF